MSVVSDHFVFRNVIYTLYLLLWCSSHSFGNTITAHFLASGQFITFKVADPALLKQLTTIGELEDLQRQGKKKALIILYTNNHAQENDDKQLMLHLATSSWINQIACQFAQTKTLSLNFSSTENPFTLFPIDGVIDTKCSQISFENYHSSLQNPTLPDNSFLFILEVPLTKPVAKNGAGTGTSKENKPIEGVGSVGWSGPYFDFKPPPYFKNHGSFIELYFSFLSLYKVYTDYREGEPVLVLRTEDNVEVEIQSASGKKILLISVGEAKKLLFTATTNLSILPEDPWESSNVFNHLLPADWSSLSTKGLGSLVDSLSLVTQCESLPELESRTKKTPLDGTGNTSPNGEANGLGPDRTSHNVVMPTSQSDSNKDNAEENGQKDRENSPPPSSHFSAVGATNKEHARFYILDVKKEDRIAYSVQPSNEIDQNLICKVCEGILNNPVRFHTHEGHAFCKNCAIEWLRQDNPYGNIDILFENSDITPKLHWLSPSISRHKFEFAIATAQQVNALEVFCPNSDCNEVNKISEITKHFNSCLHTVYACGYDGCKYQGSLSEIEEHTAVCGWVRTYCEYCDSGMLKKNINEHSRQCDNKPTNFMSCNACRNSFLPSVFLAHLCKPCEYCHLTIKNQQMEKHILSCKQRTTLEVCPLCSKKCSAQGLFKHLGKCLTHAISEHHAEISDNRENVLIVHNMCLMMIGHYNQRLLCLQCNEPLLSTVSTVEGVSTVICDICGISLINKRHMTCFNDYDLDQGANGQLQGFDICNACYANEFSRFSRVGDERQRFDGGLLNTHHELYLDRLFDESNHTGQNQGAISVLVENNAPATIEETIDNDKILPGKEIDECFSYSFTDPVSGVVEVYLAKGENHAALESKQREDFTCSICMNICSTPTSLCSKEHSECFDCLTEWIKIASSNRATCPLCRQRVDEPKLLTELQTSINGLIVYCANSFCTTTVPIESVSAHYVQCEHTVDRCPHTGCTHSAGRNTLSTTNHQEVCEYRFVECQFCKGRLPAKNLNHHEICCLYRSENCENCRYIYRSNELPQSHRCYTCVFCKEKIDFRAMADHQETCISRPIPCLNCNKAFMGTTWFLHTSSCVQKIPSDNEKVKSLKQVATYLSKRCAPYLSCPECDSVMIHYLPSFTNVKSCSMCDRLTAGYPIPKCLKCNKDKIREFLCYKCMADKLPSINLL